MRTSLLCALVFLVASDTSQALFFQYPKRALMSFLEALGGHKQVNPIHHYHMHYYPVPVILPKPPPPPKIEIDLTPIHSHEHLFHDADVVSPDHSDWSSSPSHENWASESKITPVQQKSWGWENNELLEKDHAYKEVKPPGILLQVPLHQRIVFYQQPVKDTKSTLLSTLLKKLRRLNDALFHPEEDCNEHHHDTAPHITNSLSYAPSH